MTATFKEKAFGFILLLSIILSTLLICWLIYHADKEVFDIHDYESGEHQAVIEKVETGDISNATPYIRLKEVGETTHIAETVDLRKAKTGDEAVYVKSKDGQTFAVIKIISREDN